MKIADQSVVTLVYSLHLGDGVIVDSCDESDPLVYLHGEGEIVPGLEDALEGLEKGATTKVVVQPDEGYGDRDERAVQVLARSAFARDEIKEGDEFVAEDDEGHHVPVTIKKIAGDKVTVDFNHPLAGKVLHFSIEVKDVRAATEEELSHGHAHDGDGHHHH